MCAPAELRLFLRPECNVEKMQSRRDNRGDNRRGSKRWGDAAVRVRQQTDRDCVKVETCG